MIPPVRPPGDQRIVVFTVRCPFDVQDRAREAVNVSGAGRKQKIVGDSWSGRCWRNVKVLVVAREETPKEETPRDGDAERLRRRERE